MNAATFMSESLSKTHETHVNKKLLRTASRLLSLLLMGVGLVVLLGWHTKNTALVQVHPSFVPMQYNTALCFFVMGWSAFLMSKGYLKCSSVGFFVSMTIGLVTLMQYVFGVNYGLDELWMDHFVEVKTSHPGRMAPNTALCFACSGLLGLMLSSFKHKPNAICSLLCSLVFALGFLAFGGYVYGIEVAYGWGNLTRMALHTSLCFMVLSSSLYLLALQHLKTYTYSWFTIPISTVTFIFFILLWEYIDIFRVQYEFEDQDDRLRLVQNLVLVIGVVFSVLSGAIVYFYFRSFQKNQELQVVLDKLERSYRHLEDFSHTISHDIKEPLRSISYYSTILKEELGEGMTEDTQEFLDSIHRICDRTSDMIEDLLSISLSDYLSGPMEKFKLGDLIEDLKESIALFIKEHRAQVIVDHPEAWVYAHRSAMQEVFLNLVINGIKYNQSETPTIHIGLDEAREDALVTAYYVKDNGIGIEEKDHRFIFRMFRRLSKSVSFGDGSGKGLTLARNLVWRHGGELWLDSSSHSGSAFYLSLKKK